MRRAYRRPINLGDRERIMRVYREARQNSGFEAGIEFALAAILVSSDFVFRIERAPANVAPKTAYHLDDITLATRLSFFLWSSLPDEQLLGLAERRKLRQAGILTQEARRMLADPRSSSLVTNFASQWLQLRNLDAMTPDPRLFADFDENLRQAMRRETQLLFEETLRSDLSVSHLLSPGHTFVNERLAKHYQIPKIYGSRFRRVAMPKGSQRGGILRHGSILTITSYATRTSPVLRGNWILENILGTPPPPPPPNVEALGDNTVSGQLSVRERLAQHREHAQCAACHNLMDPPGFALENFDAVGQWRTLEGEKPVDARGGLPDGQEFVGVDGLEMGLLERPDLFATALTEKLMTYALGRGVTHQDAPAIRKVVQQAGSRGYRLSDLVIGVVESTPFQMRMSN